MSDHSPPAFYSPENNSGQGPRSSLPRELRRWNWGAFFLNWIWGIGNSTYIALLMFVPVINFVMPFVLGAKGNEWAWRNRYWRSVADFRKTQRRWAIAGVIVACAVLGFFPALFTVVMGSMKMSTPYRMAMEEVRADDAVVTAIGSPIRAGFLVSGSINISGGSGSSDLRFMVRGPEGHGTVYTTATREAGDWAITALILDLDEEGRIDLIRPLPSIEPERQPDPIEI